MPKNKKQKTHHHHQTGATKGDLTHEEIWDDSALLRSWNDAVREYEYYHSIHARGEDVEEVLRQAELADSDQAQTTAAQMTNPDVPQNGLDKRTVEGEDVSSDEGEISDDDHLDQARASTLGTAKEGFMSTKQAQTSISLNSLMPAETKIDVRQLPNTNNAALHKSEPSTTESSAPVPIHPANTQPTSVPAPASTSIPATDSITLENIKMAYYWAGYYSGLHDGQQQQQQQQQKQPQ